MLNSYNIAYWPWDFSFVPSNTLSFSSGDGVDTMRCFTVRIYDDTWVENDEYFIISLSNRYRTRVAPGTTTINILDNDGERHQL
jgi:hypothetical protein